MMNSKKCSTKLGVKNLITLLNIQIFILIRLPKNDGKYRIFNESKNIYIAFIPETEPFNKINVVSN